MTNSDRGREGVKNHENLADVICTCPLTVISEHAFMIIWKVEHMFLPHRTKIGQKMLVLVLYMK